MLVDLFIRVIVTTCVIVVKVLTLPRVLFFTANLIQLGFAEKEVSYFGTCCVDYIY